MTETVKYPNVEVDLIGEDGDAFSILGRVRRAMRKGGVSEEEIKKFHDEATSGDYNHLLQTVMEWVTTDPDYDEDEDELDQIEWDLDDDENE